MEDLQSAESVIAPPGSRRQNPKSSITTEIIDFRVRCLTIGTQKHGQPPCENRRQRRPGTAAEPQPAHLAKVTGGRCVYALRRPGETIVP
jgi:hypothetical protein